MSFDLCSSNAIVAHAGLNVNVDAAASAALLEQFSEDAEGFITALSRIDWVANATKVPTNMKKALTSACARLGANDLIKTDMGGYTGRGEAEDMININHDIAVRLIGDAAKGFRDSKTKTFMGVE